MTSPKHLLQKYWGYSLFKEPQEEIIEAVLAQKNVIALLPTGGGKSICFQIPALINEGVCIVISPLIALMQDQVANLTEKGIKAIAVTAALSQDEIVDLFDNLRYGNYKFLYLSPEKLQSPFIQSKIGQLKVNTIAIDEAHCISEWGHDFRPSYRNIKILKEIHPEAPIIALTATATEHVLNDIATNLELDTPSIFKKSLIREQLAYNLHKTEAIYDTVKQLLKKIKGPVIIYASSRKATKSVSLFLNANGFQSSYYHGGLPPVEKREAFANWMSEQTPIMVATNAFGMGIDKDNVSTIIHIHLPFSLENYMQEAGRAGRNGQKAVSIILYNEGTIFEFENQFEKGKVTVDFVKKVYFNLNQHFQISLGEKLENIVEFNLTVFCKKYELSILKTYNAIQVLNNELIIRIDENFNRKSTLEFTVSHHKLLNYCSTNTVASKLIKLILRNYGGIFDSPQKIDEYALAQKINTSSFQIKTQLHNLEKDGLLTYKPVTGDTLLEFLVPREDDRTISNIAKHIKQQNSIKQQKAGAVNAYVENTTHCRSLFLLNYFGEINAQKCGRCDVCLSKNTKDTLNIDAVSEEVLSLLEQHKQLSSRALVDASGFDKNTIISTLQILLEKNKIAITSQNKFELKLHD
tara:strand:+ start:655402 stop:657309 length:1908 start_codon:yes stop_codon:yes gene_type:complete